MNSFAILNCVEVEKMPVSPLQHVTTRISIQMFKWQVSAFQYTLNESYNLPPYILASSSDYKSKALTNFGFIQRENACQNSSSNFILKGCLRLEEVQSE